MRRSAGWVCCAVPSGANVRYYGANATRILNGSAYVPSKAVFGLSHALLKHPPYAPAVNSEQHSDSGLKAHQGDDAKHGATNNAPAGMPAIGGESGCGKCQPKAEHGEEEGTEFWPPFLGYRLKVTDTLVAGFTALLFFATIALYLATRSLVKGAEATSQQELRAYVGYTHFNMGGLGQPGNVTHVSISLSWRNDGKTPALRAACIFDVTGMARSFPDGQPAFAVVEAMGLTAPITPGGIFGSPTHHFTLEEIIQSHANPIIMRGAVRYDTIFPTISRRVSDITLSIQYIGTANLNQLRLGQFDTKNFSVTSVGATSHMS